MLFQVVRKRNNGKDHETGTNGINNARRMIQGTQDVIVYSKEMIEFLNNRDILTLDPIFDNVGVTWITDEAIQFEKDELTADKARRAARKLQYIDDYGQVKSV